jgi:hypothetical protein
MSDEKIREKIRAQQNPDRANMSRKISEYLDVQNYTLLPDTDFAPFITFSRNDAEYAYLVQFKKDSFHYILTLALGDFRVSYHATEVAICHFGVAEWFSTRWEILQKELLGKRDLEKATTIIKN